MGNYAENNLIKDEHIVHETKLHWILFFTAKSFLTFFITPMIERSTSEFFITNKRIIIKVGWFNRDAYEMNLSKIESVKIKQSFKARILGYGTISIIGTGGSTEVFHNISNPVQFRKAFQECSV